MKKAHSTRSHATLSPSSAKRWMTCPGSVKLSDGIESKSSVFADEGTAAHELADMCLRNELEPIEFLGGCVNIQEGTVHRSEAPEGFDHIFPITEEMVDAVQLYVETIRSLILPGDEYEFECKLDLSHIPGMDSGTGDFLLYRPSTKTIFIFDYKHGKGVAVEAEGNPQGLTYAEGTARRFHNRGLDKVVIGIVQPRCPHPKGPVRLWTIDALDLAEFRFKLQDAAARTTEATTNYGNAELKGLESEWGDKYLSPGDHCRFCPAAATCPALRLHSLQVAEMEFSEEPPKVGDMSADAIAAVLAKAGLVKDWVKRVEERAHQMALDGTPPTGFKLVYSTSHRKFKDDVDPEYLADMLGVHTGMIMAEPKMKSPAAVVKVIGKKREAELAQYVFKPRGKTILVPESDPREPVKANAEEEFA